MKTEIEVREWLAELESYDAISPQQAIGLDGAIRACRWMLGELDVEPTEQPTEEPAPDVGPIRVTVSDPKDGTVLETRDIDDDFIVLCAGNRYISGVQAFGNGTQVVTVKRRTADADDQEG